MTAQDAPIAPPPGSRLRVAVGAAVVLVIVGLGAAVLAGLLAPRGERVEIVEEGGDAGAAPAGILVHVLGAVAAPGLYELPSGARVVDAVAAAGGFSVDADPARVNLARLLVDAEQLVVPAAGEQPEAGAGDGLVNLNRADAAALATLPRIGPALAERIIAWREANGGFRAVDDLLAVSGIGARTLEGLRALVTV